MVVSDTNGSQHPFRHVCPDQWHPCHWRLRQALRPQCQLRQRSREWPAVLLFIGEEELAITPGRLCQYGIALLEARIRFDLALAIYELGTTFPENTIFKDGKIDLTCSLGTFLLFRTGWVYPPDIRDTIPVNCHKTKQSPLMLKS